MDIKRLNSLPHKALKQNFDFSDAYGGLRLRSGATKESGLHK
ncbi:hypothetical protein ACWATR_37775 [Nostoc sp. UIC 10890]